MIIYLGLGSNMPDRKKNLIQSLDLLAKQISIIKTSPVYETPALLAPDAPPSWNRPFLNMAIKAETHFTLDELWPKMQSIEVKMGRSKNRKKWSPRIIDIDVLTCSAKSQKITVPHSGLPDRDFFLSSFSDIAGPFVEPSHKKTILKMKRDLADKTPAFMDIFNLTPDSFSSSDELYIEKGRHLQLKRKIEESLNHSVQWMDVGGCSTRPGAGSVSPEQEWKRIQPFFSTLKNYPRHLTKISVDTFRPEVAGKALDCGAHAINDVSGLSDPKMIHVLKESSCDYVLMHSLTVPADKEKTIPENKNPIREIKAWLDQKLNELEKNNIPLSRIIFDPGIGFGKTAVQSLEIIQNIHEFFEYPLRILVGHSNKSFISLFSNKPAHLRGAESIGLSIDLAKKGVDILRVHQASEHSRAWLAYKHSRPRTS